MAHRERAVKKKRIGTFSYNKRNKSHTTTRTDASITAPLQRTKLCVCLRVCLYRSIVRICPEVIPSDTRTAGRSITMFACQCLNITIVLNDETVITSVTTDPGPASLTNKTNQPRSLLAQNAGLLEGKSSVLVTFFQELVGPVQDATITVQLKAKLKTIPCDNWSVWKCVNCDSLPVARDASNPANILINGTLAVTAEEISRRKALENYSPAYRIVLDERSVDFRGVYRKDQYRSLLTAAANTLDSTNDQNELLESLRAFMRTETQLANERIARFTQEMNEQLSNLRDRAEQDYLFLAQTIVPELVDSNGSRSSVFNNTATVSPRADKALQPLTTSLTGTPVATGVVTAPGSQMETPPWTPECLPMSTGNSPPSIVTGTVGAGNSTLGFKAEQPASLSSSAANTLNNNNSSNQGAINKPPTQQQQQHQHQQHSMSTNLFANHGNNAMGASMTAKSGIIVSVGNLAAISAQRFINNTPQRPPHLLAQQQQQQQQSMFDSDCLFDIDGMENDKTPPPDAITDDENCDYNDESIDNNNLSEGGVIIPRQYGRQTTSIAKSLPISMPKNMAPYRTSEEDLDEMVEDAVDIAASIKAIAKSVHGEAVFGDLPRRQIQKFTSQI
uniref:Uncharacterized protein n=1 Tax=Anopheles farauti TaxID=69004 RepID=A0A182Q3Q9_9DIPT